MVENIVEKYKLCDSTTNNQKEAIVKKKNSLDCSYLKAILPSPVGLGGIYVLQPDSSYTT